MCTTSGNVKIGTDVMDNILEVLPKTNKTQTILWSANPISGLCIHRKWHHHFKEVSAHSHVCGRTLYHSEDGKTNYMPVSRWTREDIPRYVVNLFTHVTNHVQGTTAQLWKEGDLDVCENMYKLGIKEKQNMPDTGRELCMMHMRI